MSYPLSSELSQHPPLVFIVLLNWNGWQDTIECLESVFRLTYPNFKVVVCDNASSDNSLEHIRAWASGEQSSKCTNPQLEHLTVPAVLKPIQHQMLSRIDAEAQNSDGVLPPLNLIQTGSNLGFASGNNVGLRYALRWRCNFVWLLNNDTVVQPDSLSHLIDRTAQQNNRCMCGSTLLYYDSPQVVQAFAGASYNSKTSVSHPIGQNRSFSLNNLADLQDANEVEKQLDCLIGASMFVPSSLLLEVGLLDEEYFLYSEENDWAERGKRLGYRLAYAPKSVIYHKLGSSTQSTHAAQSRNFTSDYYQTRSRMIFTRKFYPSDLIWVRLTLVLGGIKRLLWGKPKHAWMQWKMAAMPNFDY